MYLFHYVVDRVKKTQVLGTRYSTMEKNMPKIAENTLINFRFKTHFFG